MAADRWPIFALASDFQESFKDRRGISIKRRVPFKYRVFFGCFVKFSMNACQHQVGAGTTSIVGKHFHHTAKQPSHERYGAGVQRVELRLIP